MIRPKAYPLLERCVEQGLRYGHTRAHKHVDDPSVDAILEAQLNAIMVEISEWFEFDQDPTENS